MAMTLLKGGPKNGEIIQTSRNEYGFSYVTEIWKKNKNTNSQRLQSVKEIFYESTHTTEKHPAKKKGNVKVFKFCSRRPAWATPWKSPTPRQKNDMCCSYNTIATEALRAKILANEKRIFYKAYAVRRGKLVAPIQDVVVNVGSDGTIISNRVGVSLTTTEKEEKEIRERERGAEAGAGIWAKSRGDQSD